MVSNKDNGLVTNEWSYLLSTMQKVLLWFQLVFAASSPGIPHPPATHSHFLLPELVVALIRFRLLWNDNLFTLSSSLITLRLNASIHLGPHPAAPIAKACPASLPPSSRLVTPIPVHPYPCFSESIVSHFTACTAIWFSSCQLACYFTPCLFHLCIFPSLLPRP